MTRRLTALGIGAILLAACAVKWPILGMPAFLVVVLATIVVEGRLRWVVGILGGTLAMAAFTRFLLVYAAPNIVIAGEIATEDRAVDHLREIRWAALQSESRPDRSTTGFTLRSLVGPVLDPTAYFPTEAATAIYAISSYWVTLYAPPHTTGFVAYAWPAGEKHGGRRAFAIDQADHICELPAGAFVGPEHPPPMDAAFTAPGQPCRPPWQPWKNKKAKP